MSAPQSPRQPDDTAPYGPPAPSRYRTVHLQRAKDEGRRFAMLTAYDQFAAKAFEAVEAEVMPEHITVKATMKVRKCTPKARCV